LHTPCAVPSAHGVCGLPCPRIGRGGPHVAANPTGQGGALARAAAVTGAILRQRCPRCRRGPMFRGLLTMNDPCPVCGLIFQREEGYFLGAMYVSSAFSMGLMLAAYALVAAVVPDAGLGLTALLILLLYLPLVPAVFRYSRVLWVYFDR